MKNYLIVLASVFALALPINSFAAGNELAYKRITELDAIAGTSVDADNDLVVVYDTSAKKTTKMPAAPFINSLFEDTTATNTLTTAECGKTITLNSATEFVTTLPAPTAGCKFTFIVKAAPASASYTVVTASSANIIIGHVETADIDGAADGDSSTADDTITFADGVAVVGDRVDIVSDGTSWYYIGHAKTYNGITASQAS